MATTVYLVVRALSLTYLGGEILNIRDRRETVTGMVTDMINLFAIQVFPGDVSVWREGWRSVCRGMACRGKWFLESLLTYAQWWHEKEGKLNDFKDT